MSGEQAGRVSLLLATHHGFFNDQSGRTGAAVGDSAAGGDREQRSAQRGWPLRRTSASRRCRASGLWQSHLALATDKAHNTSDEMIANPKPSAECKGHWISVAVDVETADYVVTNGRNNFSKTYTS